MVAPYSASQVGATEGKEHNRQNALPTEICPCSIDDWPVRLPTDEVYALTGYPILCIVVVNQHVGIPVGKDSLVTRSVDGAVAGQDLGAAARQQRLTVLVDVWARYAGRPADYDAVGASHTAAALIERIP